MSAQPLPLSERLGAAGGLVPLADVARRIGQELGELAGLADALQDLVRQPGGVDPAHSHFIASAQNFDLLIQRLDAVRQFMGDLAHLAPADCRVDAAAAAQAITLKRLKDRLSFSDGETDEDTDFQLF